MPRSNEFASFYSGVVLVASVVGATSAWAQSTDDEDPVLDEVVVVAHKNARPVSDIAANVTVLTRADIDDSISASFADVFRYTPGVDYEQISGYLNLSPFETERLVAVTPIATAVLNDGQEFVRMRVRPDSAYIVAAASSAAVSLVPERLDLAEWRARHFPNDTGELEAFAKADPGNTGIDNLSRYAFALDPGDPLSSGGRPTYEIRDGRLMVTYRQAASVLNLQYSVQVSSDLVTWHDDPARLERRCQWRRTRR